MIFEKPTFEHLFYSVVLTALALLAFSSFRIQYSNIISAEVLGTQSNYAQSIASLPFVEPADKNISRSFDFVNNLRADKGLPALILNTELNSNATSYANYLATECGVMRHGKIKQFLGTFIGSKKVVYYGENLSIHDSSLDIALDQLKNSHTHYALIVGDFTHIGLSVVGSDKDECGQSIFVVQHFANLVD